MKKKIGKKTTAVIITGFVFLIITCMHLIGVFNFLEYKSYDMRVRFWAETSYSQSSDDIILIYLDQDSIDWAQKEMDWGWPWPREAYAEMVDFMNLSNAKALAFDIIFSEPSIYRNARQDKILDEAVRALEEAERENTGQTRTQTPRSSRTEGGLPGGSGALGGPGGSAFRTAIEAVRSLSNRVDDAIFEEASRNYGNVVQTVMFSSQTGNIHSWPAGLNVPLFQPENFGAFLDRFSIGFDERGQFPINELRDSAGALGSITGIPDSDGIIRRLRPFTLFDGKAIPGLSAASLIVAGKGTHIVYDEKTSNIDWEGISIPVDKDGFALLRYRGDLQFKYNPYRAMDILLSARSYESGHELEFGEYITPMGTVWNKLTKDNFEDRYIFLGYNAQGLFDIFSTPISSLYPGVGCHVTMLDNMLQGDFIRESPMFVNLLILLFVVVFIVCLTMFTHRISLSVGGMIFIVIAVFTGAFFAYQFGGLWVPMITYLAGILASFVTVTLYNYATEGSQKRFIKSAFSQYVSPKLVDQIIHDPSKLNLGGEKREMTAVFTDIRAFSTFSEALGDPAKLVELLNFYLTKMSNIILDHEGTIDKYIGDAIVGFFGAPIQMNNHAALACRSAIMMKKAELEINREALEKGLVNDKVMEALLAKGKVTSLNDPCPVYTRLGINSGDMVAGNMGTPNKTNYTIMGNAVNLAARLEGVNDQYDTSGILISEYTKDSLSANGAANDFIMRPLSRVRVVGINTPLRLYELLDIASEASPQLLEMVKNWEKAFLLYEQRDFKAAQTIFHSIYNNKNTLPHGEDLVAKKYLKRCINYLSSPPDDKIWDNGVDSLTKK
ncbi:MAG: adenylate/guanylate cyclase domain-containing protein [Treponema sp.]|nr:adenylate/guanylate cyclase domain-containing protein [Treponema sp.]